MPGIQCRFTSHPFESAPASGVPPQRTRELVQDMMTRCTGVRSGRPEYSLRSVQALLSEECKMYRKPAEMVDWMTSRLKQHVPPPGNVTKFLMDTNWQDKDGNPMFMAFTYEPFEDRIQAVCRNKDDTYREPFDPRLLSGQYLLFPPLKLS